MQCFMSSSYLCQYRVLVQVVMIISHDLNLRGVLVTSSGRDSSDSMIVIFEEYRLLVQVVMMVTHHPS